MKYFIQYLTKRSSGSNSLIKSRFVGNLTLQGSNDDFEADINEIVIVGDEIHEGWNSYDLSQTLPSYNSYRLCNEIDGGLEYISEIELIGNLVLDSHSETEDCPVTIT